MKSAETHPPSRVTNHQAPNMTASDTAAISSHCARPGSRRQNGNVSSAPRAEPNQRGAGLALLVTSIHRLVVDGILHRLEFDLDALQGPSREGEFVGVRIADARQRIAPHVQRGPRDEPAR